MTSKNRLLFPILLFAIAVVLAPGGGRNAASAQDTRAGGYAGPADLRAGDYERPVPGWPGRPYDLHIPGGYAPSRPAPVVMAIHGGGANSKNMARLSSPAGNTEDEGSLNKVADRYGFVVVYPNGTSHRAFRNVRTWNAGGGKNGLTCVSEYACENNIDDIGYFRTLLDDLKRAVNVDSTRIYATGISNGAAMSHRLACEFSDSIAAIAPVAGANQFSAVEPCSPPRAVSVLQIHGTDDRSWPYAGGKGGPLSKNHVFVAVPQTISEWVSRNGCNSKPVIERLPDADPRDGTRVKMETYDNCRDRAEVVFYIIEGGGHTWPGGYQYLAERIVGKTSMDMNANEAMLKFFRKHAIR